MSSGLGSRAACTSASAVPCSSASSNSTTPTVCTSACLVRNSLSSAAPLALTNSSSGPILSRPAAPLTAALL